MSASNEPTGEPSGEVQFDLEELPDLDDDVVQRTGRLRRVLRDILRNRLAKIGLLILFVVLVLGVLAPVFAPYGPQETDFAAVREAPSMSHLFGTDFSGRDVFSRILYGARLTPFIGFAAVLLASTVGTVLGAVAGYFGGWVDEVVMRIVDILYAFPFLVLAIALMAILGQGLQNVIIALALIGWITFARVVRGEVLSVKEEEYVLAARAVGVSRWKIIFRHVIPNVLAPVIVLGTLNSATYILEAAALGFLGLGAEPGTAEWGAMLSESRASLIQGDWWITVFPGIFIFVLVLGLNLLGDGLRDALDPGLNTEEF